MSQQTELCILCAASAAHFLFKEKYHEKNLIAIVLIIAALLLTGCESKSSKYESALLLLSDENFSEAYSAFCDLEGYKKAPELAFYAKEVPAIKKNNPVLQSANEFLITMSKVSKTGGAVQDKDFTINVVSKSTDSLKLKIYIRYIIDFDRLDDISVGDYYNYTVNCNKYGLDADTCEKLLLMDLDEVVNYGKSK